MGGVHLRYTTASNGGIMPTDKSVPVKLENATAWVADSARIIGHETEPQNGGDCRH
jgi:hypothetical protein